MTNVCGYWWAVIMSGSSLILWNIKLLDLELWKFLYWCLNLIILLSQTPSEVVTIMSFILLMKTVTLKNKIHLYAVSSCYWWSLFTVWLLYLPARCLESPCSCLSDLKSPPDFIWCYQSVLHGSHKMCVVPVWFSSLQSAVGQLALVISLVTLVMLQSKIRKPMITVTDSKVTAVWVYFFIVQPGCIHWHHNIN